MTGFKGSLDRLRENLEVLDEQISNARIQAKGKGKDSNTLQWAKTLRDLVELRNETLDRIKVHLLGRDETGSPREPQDCFQGNQEVEYERLFKNMLHPWTSEDLKLECEDCGAESEEVSTYEISHDTEPDEYFDLCEKCYGKRTAESNGKSEDPDVAEHPASKADIRVILQTAALSVKVLRTLPVDQRIAKLEELLGKKFECAPGMEPAMEAYRGALQKEFDNAKGAKT